MSLEGMAGHQCFLFYGAATLDACAELCSVRDVSRAASRPEVDMTPWENNGFKRGVVGDLAMKIEITGIYRRENQTDVTDFDFFQAAALSSGAVSDTPFDYGARGRIEHVFILDKFLVGLYYASMYITDLSQDQPLNDAVTYRFSLVPNAEPHVYKNGAIV